MAGGGAATLAGVVFSPAVFFAGAFYYHNVEHDLLLPVKRATLYTAKSVALSLVALSCCFILLVESWIIGDPLMRRISLSNYLSFVSLGLCGLFLSAALWPAFRSVAKIVTGLVLTLAAPGIWIVAGLALFYSGPAQKWFTGVAVAATAAAFFWGRARFYSYELVGKGPGGHARLTGLPLADERPSKISAKWRVAARHIWLNPMYIFVLLTATFMTGFGAYGIDRLPPEEKPLFALVMFLVLMAMAPVMIPVGYAMALAAWQQYVPSLPPASPRATLFRMVCAPFAFVMLVTSAFLLVRLSPAAVALVLTFGSAMLLFAAWLSVPPLPHRTFARRIRLCVWIVSLLLPIELFVALWLGDRLGLTGSAATEALKSISFSTAAWPLSAFFLALSIFFWWRAEANFRHMEAVPILLFGRRASRRTSDG